MTIKCSRVESSAASDCISDFPCGVIKTMVLFCARNDSTAAKWSIVDNVMFVRRPVAQVMNAKIDNSIFPGALHDAFAQRSATDFRKKGQDVDLHLGNGAVSL